MTLPIGRHSYRNTISLIAGDDIPSRVYRAADEVARRINDFYPSIGRGRIRFQNRSVH